METKKAVVVTTEHRGVFFGYVDDETTAPEKLTLTDARMCISWSSSIRGVLGLASNGPDSNCRISTNIPKITLWKITSIMECSPESVENWEKSPWS